jgi:hypothetical protein
MLATRKEIRRYDKASPPLSHCPDLQIPYSHFNTWITSSAEPNDASARFQVCFVVDDACIASVEGVLGEGSPMDEFDHLGLATVYLIHRRGEEGESEVCASFFVPFSVPRTFGLINGDL